jgi:hypothetical protein
MTTFVRHAVLLIAILLVFAPTASAACDFYCYGRNTLNEHCTEMIGGQGDMATCRDDSSCAICFDEYGLMDVCCIPNCHGNVCLLT